MTRYPGPEHIDEYRVYEHNFKCIKYEYVVVKRATFIHLHRPMISSIRRENRLDHLFPAHAVLYTSRVSYISRRASFLKLG